MVSFAIAEAAREAGAVLAAGVPVAEIRPGEGVVLEGGEVIRARSVISNADPRRLVDLCGDAVPPAYRSRIDGWRMTSPVVKVNVGLDRLPRFSSVPDSDWPCGSMVSITTGIADAQAAFEACTRGIPSPGFAELYFQTAYDPSVAPPGKHVLSCFVQYAPYHLRGSTWDEERERFGDTVVDTLSEYAPNLKSLILHRQVLTPLDLEREFGLTEGNIFHGELSLEQLFFLRPVAGWAKYRTPIRNLYLCGSGAHPGGGIMAAPGRNAAIAVIGDQR
jgi:phytoene dehydrogenase-like protein